MMIIFYLLGALVGFIATLLVGFWAGRLSIADACLTRGVFNVSGIEYECIGIFKQDRSEYGLPDVLRDEQDNGAFAENTLAKLKFLDLKARDDLKYKSDQKQTEPDKAHRDFFGKVRHYDCGQCCRDAGDIPRTMILCPTCGNKRCPKASNHLFKCSHSNAVGQVGELDGSAQQQRIDGSFLYDAVRPDQDVISDLFDK